jgi:6-phosphogluconolactonase
MTSKNESFLLASGYAAADEPGIRGFVLDEASGALRPQGSWAGVENPSFITVHPSGVIYVTSETGEGSVTALRLGKQPGAAEVLSQRPSGGDHPCHLEFDPSGQLLAVANYSSGTARLIPREAAGGLAEPGPVARHEGAGPNAERQDGPHAHSTIFTPDGRHAVVADLGIDRLVVYRYDQGGVATRVGAAVCRPGAGPRHMVWHPSGRLLYVANELDNTVSVFAYDGAGGLAEQAHHSTLPPGAGHSQVADIHLDAGATRLYVSNRGDNSIAVFTVGADGALAPLAIRPCGGDWPRNFALSPGGGFLVVANQNSGELAVLPVLAGPEALGAPVARAVMPGASCVIFPPVDVGWTP